MTKEELKTIEQCPGIYLFKNVVNNKCYVGQAINLHNRLKSHYYTFIGGKRLQHILLYRAMNKYGLDNFSLTIVWKLEEYQSLSKKEIKDILDKKRSILY